MQTTSRISFSLSCLQLGSLCTCLWSKEVLTTWLFVHLSLWQRTKSLSVVSKSSRIFNEASAKCDDDRLDSGTLLYCEADIAMDDRLDSVMLLYCEADITMDDRLDGFMLLYGEADIAMDLNLDSLVDNWAKIRHRRIEI